MPQKEKIFTITPDVFLNSSENMASCNQSISVRLLTVQVLRSCACDLDLSVANRPPPCVSCHVFLLLKPNLLLGFGTGLERFPCPTSASHVQKVLDCKLDSLAVETFCICCAASLQI